MHDPRCVLCKWGRDGYVKTQMNFTKFIKLTTCFDSCGPSSGHKCTMKTICSVHIVFLVLLWPEGGPQRPKHVVNIIKLVKCSCVLTYTPLPNSLACSEDPRHWHSSTYWATWIHSNPSYSPSLNSILILSSHLSPCFLSGLSHSDFPNKM
jgi:hypothetical protein